MQQWLVRMFASRTYTLIAPTASLPLQEGTATKIGIRQRSQLYRDDPLWGMVGEELLSIMDGVYGVLVTIDFPDAVTGGLRRTTDIVRGILEKTPGRSNHQPQAEGLGGEASCL